MKQVEFEALKRVVMCWTNEGYEEISVRKIQEEAESLYRATKTFGLNGIVFQSEEGGIVNLSMGNTIPEGIRALAAYLTMNKYGMREDASSISRIQGHFGNVDIRSILGFRLGVKRNLLSGLSTLEAVERIMETRMNDQKVSVNIDALFDLVIKKDEKVDLWALWSQAEELYTAVVTFGLENVTAYARELGFHGAEIPERIRALTLFLCIHVWRMPDNKNNLDVLGERMNLSSSITSILGDTGIFKDTECISVAQIAGRYLHKEKAGIFRNSPVNVRTMKMAIEEKIMPSEEDIENIVVGAEAVYRTAKITGIENTSVRYIDLMGEEVQRTGTEIPERIRAFCAEVVIGLYRMNDGPVSRSRIAKHLGLSMNSDEILYGTGLSVSCKGSGEIISIAERLRRYCN